MPAGPPRGRGGSHPRANAADPGINNDSSQCSTYSRWKPKTLQIINGESVILGHAGNPVATTSHSWHWHARGQSLDLVLQCVLLSHPAQRPAGRAERQRSHLVWTAQYSTWGISVREEWQRYDEADRPVQLPQQSATQGVPLKQNLRMQGQYLDKEMGLHYNTFRYYDADLGAFTTQDSIGLGGGINRYQHAPNPVAWTEPFGLTCAKAFAKKQGTAERWVGTLAGQTPGQVDALLKKKGYTPSTHQTSPNATPHTRYTRTNKMGGDVLDYHPDGPNAVHKSDSWRVCRDGEVQGRIGRGTFGRCEKSKIALFM